MTVNSVHADPPPPIVSEPDGINYATGPALGKGGFAICHRAERYNGSKPTGQIVALKIVKTKMEPAKLAQKFVTELQIHSKLTHPNIVTFYRAFSYSTSTYVVLELCSNGSLADMLKRRKQLTLPEIRRLVIQVCGAVKYLHHRHIVHRDLKTGNLFLDENMNVKVGDFGLAALLVTGRDLEHTRRTTMCGTPNYLAPEILERGKGHDEKVDLWAIGVIAYTLAVGKAPFHASTKEEIYKKLKSGTYTWPELSATTNQSTDLRDLVSSLLVPEELRPCPDQIVSHPFFKIAYVPSSIPAGAREKMPIWPEVCIPSPEIVRRGYSDTWFHLCKESGVGQYAEGKCFVLNNGRKVRSIVSDIQREVQFNMVPTIPLAEDIVYVSTVNDFDAPLVSPVPESQQPGTIARGLKEISHNEVATQRPAVARTQRAANDAELMPPPRTTSRLARTGTVRKAARTISEEAANSSETARVKSDASAGQAETLKASRTRNTGTAIAAASALRDLNTGPSSVYQTAVSQQLVEEKPKRAESVKRSADASLARRPRGTRTLKERPASAIETSDQRLAGIKKTLERPRSPTTRPRPIATLDELKDAYPFKYRRKHQVNTEVVDILSDHDCDDRRKQSSKAVVDVPPTLRTTREPPVTQHRRQRSEVSTAVPGTDPAAVLEKLSIFRDNLAAALANKHSKHHSSSEPEDPTKLPFVSRWVDYSRKHGIGYVLADGTIGCIINASTGGDAEAGEDTSYDAPVAHALVRNGQPWLRKVLTNRNFEGMESVPLEVYENLGERSLQRDGNDAHVSAGLYRKVYKGIGSVKQGPLAAEAERRRILGVLWLKFGRYMLKTMGEDEERDEISGRDKQTPVNFVRFFQRLGNVGFWVFVDGSLQVHFPDHTKLVISPSGSSVSATVLAADSAAHLAEHGDLQPQHVNARVVIADSTRALLFDSSRSGSGSRARLVRVNHLADKLAFVREVVAQWVRNGGLGRLDEDGLEVGAASKLAWSGPAVRDMVRKVDRVTVGRFGGDEVAAVRSEA